MDSANKFRLLVNSLGIFENHYLIPNSQKFRFLFSEALKFLVWSFELPLDWVLWTHCMSCTWLIPNSLLFFGLLKIMINFSDIWWHFRANEQCRNNRLPNISSKFNFITFFCHIFLILVFMEIYAFHTSLFRLIKNIECAH